MCATSFVMDHYKEKWQTLVPGWIQTIPIAEPAQTFALPQPAISAEEIAEFRKLLERAREYDKRTNQPDCEMDEKRQAVLVIAKQLGVEISFL